MLRRRQSLPALRRRTGPPGSRCRVRPPARRDGRRRSSGRCGRAQGRAVIRMLVDAGNAVLASSDRPALSATGIDETQMSVSPPPASRRGGRRTRPRSHGAHQGSARRLVSGQPVVRAAWSARAGRAPPGERAWTEPAADPTGPTGQARDPQPGPHAGQIGELSPPSGPGQRRQHCQAKCERSHQRGGHRPGPQPQQAQAQAHQRQHGHAGTAARRRGAAPTRPTIGSPSGGAHDANDEAPAMLGPLPCLTLPGPGAPAIRWATARPPALAATECRAGPARSARGVLPPPAAVQPTMRTAIAPSNAPARRDRAPTGQSVIAPSRHGSSASPLTHRGQDRFPPGVRSRPASLAWC